MSDLTDHLNPQSRAYPARWPGPHWLGMGLVALSYFVILGWFLASTRGLPYVLDNNETFSSLVHARNILHFGVRETFGLTDETYGLERAQHPYVYTHQGNLPRFYALLLYALGARTAESQIASTTFTVGLLGLLFAYHFFSRVATPLFALTYCLLLITDYVMQTQWLVNTWRTWHHFFMFSSLLCVHGLARRGRLPAWVVAITLLNFACLAYFEIAFATFVTLLAVVYAGLTCRRRPRRVLQGWLLLGGGAALGVAVLIAQLIGYLGWDGFAENVKLTFLARNHAPADPSELSRFRSELWSFVERHRLVFWDNVSTGAPSGAAVALFRWCLLPYTPVLVFVAMLISSAWALSFMPAFDVAILWKKSRQTWSARSALPWVVGAAVVFVWATMTDGSYAGVSDESRWLEGVGAVVAAAGVGVLAFALREQELGGAAPPASRVMSAAALLLVFAGFARFHSRLYGDGVALEPQFRELISRSGGGTAWHIAVLGGAGLAVSVLLSGRSLMGQERRRFTRLFAFVVSGVVAGVAVFGLFPGYFMTGYLTRYCPLTTWVHLVPFAAAFYVLARVSLNSTQGLTAASRSVPPATRSSAEPPEPRGRTAVPGQQLIVSGGALLLLGLLSWYWLVLQVRWVYWIEPTAALLKELQKPQYKSASFVVDNYAAPVAFTTKGWAYFDPVIGNSELRNPDGKFYLRRDFRYLWLADKRSNPRYFEPNYFVCWSLRQLLDPVSGRRKCEDVRIVAEARSGSSLLGHREVARDESGRDGWSIIKLDWTYPPGSGKKIQWHKRQYRRTLALPK